MQCEHTFEFLRVVSGNGHTHTEPNNRDLISRDHLLGGLKRKRGHCVGNKRVFHLDQIERSDKEGINKGGMRCQKKNAIACLIPIILSSLFFSHLLRFNQTPRPLSIRFFLPSCRRVTKLAVELINVGRFQDGFCRRLEGRPSDPASAGRRDVLTFVYHGQPRGWRVRFEQSRNKQEFGCQMKLSCNHVQLHFLSIMQLMNDASLFGTVPQCLPEAVRATESRLL